MTHPDLDAEQRYFDALYRRLDEEIAKAEQRLSEVRFQAVGGLHQARFEREAFAGHLEDRVATLRAHRRDDLCFGRIDMADGRQFYIGRLGLADEHHEPLLVDWRAPAAAPFYQATPRNRMDVVRRRHFLTRRREIVGIEDEVLDAEALPEGAAESLRGEAVLQYAMSRARTGRMREIAATLQREQDEVIRAPLSPAVFVQGGPGTGKTAVALHRAAFLLYTYRRQLSARDLLVIGPNRLFLRYIENVLPSLGETGVALTALPQLYGRRDWAAEDPGVRAVKASLAMVDVVGRAVAMRRRPLRRSADVVVEGERLTVTPADTRPIVAAAARRPGRHNANALYVHDRLVRLLWRRGARRLLRDVMEFEDFRREMRTDRRVRRLRDRIWPVLSPEALLNDLFGFPALLAEATRGVLDPADAARLERPWSRDVRDVVWTPSDAPLLDEAARRLGPVPPQLDAVAARRLAEDDEEARAEAEYARERMRGLGGGIVPREVLQQRLLGPAAPAPPGSDEDEELDDTRLWRYAVVDEAQDVSPMEWRMLGRHAPRRAATVVGDMAQGTEPWSPRSWAEVREALDARESARVAELTVNYRTPAEVSAYGADVLAAVDPGLAPPVAIRSEPGSFAAERVEQDELVRAAAGAALRLHAELADGIACVIAPGSMVPGVAAELERRLGRSLPAPDDPAVLDAPVFATRPDLAKGLEFDVVVVADPDAIVAEAGLRALYVSATRPTRRLLVLHTGPSPLPAG